MNRRIADRLKEELSARGFTPEGFSPGDSVGYTDAYLESVELGDLLDTMVSRREKIFGSVSVVGEKIARNNYQDTVLYIDAIKSVMRKLTLP